MSKRPPELATHAYPGNSAHSGKRTHRQYCASSSLKVVSMLSGTTGSLPPLITCSLQGASKHYENTPMQYTAIFHGRKNDNFRLKSLDYFHIFAQNIDCGYTLEPPH